MAFEAGFACAKTIGFAVGNIIVRPAASSDGGTGADGERGGLPRPGGSGGGFAGGGTLFDTAGAAKIAVVVGDGAFAGGDTAGFGAPARVTLNVFWHFPQRIVRPCGPIRASSTR